MAAAVDHTRTIPKRRNLNHRRKQFAAPAFQNQDYKTRLNFYALPPTEDITLEEFEVWAIDRLKVLAELEACTFRNKTPDETADYMRPIVDKYLPLSQNSVKNPSQQLERRKDHYSHFVCRLAFSATEDLRRRFARLETQLFRLRLHSNDARDRQDFIESLQFEWEKVSPQERAELKDKLAAVAPRTATGTDDDGWFKVDWESVPELIESRKAFLRMGKAYVPMREQTSMVLGEFGRRLEAALEQTARALPRLDEDDRLSPILKHLSQNFAAPGATYDEGEGALPGQPITYANIDALAQHFPLCMRNLHMTLRKNSHLKHFSRLQYTLFLKGLGLSLEDCLIFWRQSFKLITDDQFNKEYRYNIRHAYGDVGGDSNRRGRGYPPYNCQKLLTEAIPGPGQTHGCPYRTFNVDNLTSLLQATGVSDRSVLQGVREDVGRQRYHIACNRVFDWAHQKEIKKVKEDGTWGAGELDTIVHPNAYFKRSYLLKNLAAPGMKSENGPKRDIEMQDA